METTPTAATLQETYLAVEDCRSGAVEVIAIGDDEPLDLETLLDAWIATSTCGELRRDGALMPKLPGDYYAWIQTEGRPLDSCVVWESGGFYLEQVQ